MELLRPFWKSDKHPEFISPLCDKTASEGDTATFVCKISCPIISRVSWIIPNGTEILTPSDSGTPQMSTISLMTDMMSITLGANADMAHCLGSSPSVVRRKFSASRDDQGHCRLNIKQVSLEDSGQYRCIVSSGLGNVTSAASLNVKENKSCDVPSESDSGLLWKSTFESVYSVGDIIGTGRFSIVKKATHISSGKQVAAKCIKRNGATDVQKEYQILEGLNCRFLVGPIDAYSSPQEYIIIFQLILGHQLLEYLCDRPSYDEMTICLFMQQLVTAVQYLHQKSIAHLDIKPENLLVDLSPCLKLIDFGDAQKIPVEIPHKHLGSPEFASPEILLQKPVSLQSDVWSIGVVLYVCLSGASPFLDETPLQTCQNILQGDFSFPAELFSNISPSAQVIISKMLKTDLKERITSDQLQESQWIKEGPGNIAAEIPSFHLSEFIERRKNLFHNLAELPTLL